MRNKFLEKLHTNCGGEIIPDPLMKNNWASLDQQSEMLCSLFLLYFQVEVYGGLPEYIKTKVLTTCFDLIQAF